MKIAEELEIRAKEELAVHHDLQADRLSGWQADRGAHAGEDLGNCPGDATLRPGERERDYQKRPQARSPV